MVPSGRSELRFTKHDNKTGNNKTNRNDSANKEVEDAPVQAHCEYAQQNIAI